MGRLLKFGPRMRMLGNIHLSGYHPDARHVRIKRAFKGRAWYDYYIKNLVV